MRRKPTVSSPGRRSSGDEDERICNCQFYSSTSAWWAASPSCDAGDPGIRSIGCPTCSSGENTLYFALHFWCDKVELTTIPIKNFNFAIAKAKQGKWFVLQPKLYAPYGIWFVKFGFILCPAGHSVCQTGQTLSQKGHSVWCVWHCALPSRAFGLGKGAFTMRPLTWQQSKEVKKW